jgi:hypothetical protein
LAPPLLALPPCPLAPPLLALPPVPLAPPLPDLPPLPVLPPVALPPWPGFPPVASTPPSLPSEQASIDIESIPNKRAAAFMVLPSCMVIR